MKKILVLGAGLIGSFIANKLNSEGFKVTVIDASTDNLLKLEDNIEGWLRRFEDGSDIRTEIVKTGPDLVVNAMPGHLGYTSLKAAIECGKDVVDIAFMPEDPRELNELAKHNNVTAVVDFGFAPGMSHMFVGRGHKDLQGTTQDATIYVGGLQQNTPDYKAVFSPMDVIEEYTRPARLVRDNQEVIEDPFNKLYPYEKNGKTYAGFMSDGLRTLVDSMSIPNLEEITLRSYDHFDFIRKMKVAGFFKPDHLETTAKILTDQWRMSSTDHDFSIMEVFCSNDELKTSYYMYDEYDKETSTHSMARATGLPAVAMAKTILAGDMKEKGVIVPELVGQMDRVYKRVVNYLKENGIIIEETVTKVK